MDAAIQGHSGVKHRRKTKRSYLSIFSETRGRFRSLHNLRSFINTAHPKHDEASWNFMDIETDLGMGSILDFQDEVEGVPDA